MSDTENKTETPVNTPAGPSPVQLIEVEIARDWWDEDGVRHPAGTVVQVPIEAALDGIEKGALRRAKKPE
jgi:hypothetical protein